MRRPDYIRCIQRQHANYQNQTWCGKSVDGFTFQGVDHAAENGLQHGRLVACEDCVNKVTEALKNGQ